MISQLMVLSPRGDVIILKDFKGNVCKTSPDILFRKITLWDGKGKDAPPVFCVDGTNYMYIKAGSLYWGATTKENVSPSLVLEMLNRLFWITNDYVGHVSEESVRKNFVLIYELLDEIMDYGFPQNSSTERLKEFIAMEPAVSRPSGSHGMMTAASGPKEVVKSVLSTSRTGAKEEIFVDIVEKLTAIFDASGQVRTSFIVGSVQVKSYLHGNPMIRLGLNENLILLSDQNQQDVYGDSFPLSHGSSDVFGPVVLDTFSLHECVDHEAFAQHKVLELVPPEGHFSLLTYRISKSFRPPFRVYPVVEDDALSDEKLTLYLRLESDFEGSKTASGVEVVLPLPPTVFRAHIDLDTEENEGPFLSKLTGKSFGQKAEWYAKESKIIWTLRNVPGGKEHVLRVRLTIEPGQAYMVRHEMGPLTVHFVLPGKPSTSGLDVKYMKIMKETSRSQAPSRWFRTVAMANSYIIRTD
jgi:AP-4 complex subunit mu-1